MLVGHATPFLPLLFGNFLVIWGSGSQHVSLRCLRRGTVYFSQPPESSFTQLLPFSLFGSYKLWFYTSYRAYRKEEVVNGCRSFCLLVLIIMIEDVGQLNTLHSAPAGQLRFVPSVLHKSLPCGLPRVAGLCGPPQQIPSCLASVWMQAVGTGRTRREGKEVEAL